MPFPEATRQIYERNPLAEVIAQIRFDPILIIDSQPPAPQTAQFQEAIRQEYSAYNLSATMPLGLPEQVQLMMRQMGAPNAQRQHIFAAPDRRWEVILTRESLVLKSRHYNGWEDFQARLKRIQEAFERAFRPASPYGSVNLRYIDIIQRSRLELATTPWSELLIPEIAGELASPNLGEDIDKMTNSLHCRLDNEGSFLTLKTNLALSQDGRQERCFVIDSDFHTHGKVTRVEAQNVQNIFQRFNLYSRYLFQWAIKNQLRTALRPI